MVPLLFWVAFRKDLGKERIGGGTGGNLTPERCMEQRIYADLNFYNLLEEDCHLVRASGTG